MRDIKAEAEQYAYRMAYYKFGKRGPFQPGTPEHAYWQERYTRYLEGVLGLLPDR